MGKKVREYKSGDFIFAKVKGYPAWPARVQKLNGKKYFVYFYGTGETANLPPNMIFDYAENKDKFLTKTVKRRDFNDGVKQIEHDFANNVPLEEVIGGFVAPPEDAANDSANDTANETMDDSAIADTTTADESMAEESAKATDAVDDSDDTGALVIDEGKKGRKSKADATKTPAKAKEPKTPRGKAKKDEAKDEDEEKKDEEIVSRSGRKIRPKRYIDEQTEDNATLPSPLPKKRRGGSPVTEKEGEKEKERDKSEPVKEKPVAKHYNAVTQSELEDLKEPFKQDDAEKENILITYLPSGQYVGIKLFQSRPASFKNEAARLAWDKQAATNAVTIKLQLERGQITSQSVAAQLVMDLNLTDEEKATLDKERETEEKKSRVQFLKTEMKLIELDAKIKTCLCLEKADTEQCLKLLDELIELEVKPLMLLKHPSCVETVKRMRAYVGNTPSWDLSESDALTFSKRAHAIRKQADTLYNNTKTLFTTPDGLSFWEFFSERVQQFKKATAKLSADELLELVHEPLEMSTPTSLTMKTAVDAANNENADEEIGSPKKKAKETPAKTKKQANSTPSKPALKRQSSRKQAQDEKEKEKEENKPDTEDKEDTQENTEKSIENNVEKDITENKEKETESSEVTDKEEEDNVEKESKDAEKSKKDTQKEKAGDKDTQKEKSNTDKKEKDAKEKKSADKKETQKEKNSADKKSKDAVEKEKSNEKEKGNNKKEDKEVNNKEVDKEKSKEVVDKEKNSKDSKEKNNKDAKETAENNKETENSDENNMETENTDTKETDTENLEEKDKDTEDKEEHNSKENAERSSPSEEKTNKRERNGDKKEDKKEEVSKEDKSEKDEIAEPRAKRSRDSKKTEPPPPRSPAKRKSKF